MDPYVRQENLRYALFAGAIPAGGWLDHVGSYGTAGGAYRAGMARLKGETANWFHVVDLEMGGKMVSRAVVVSRVGGLSTIEEKL